jgi:Histidine kinase-, DNA gyrase B-, and HSP90-like ATPase
MARWSRTEPIALRRSFSDFVMKHAVQMQAENLSRVIDAAVGVQAGMAGISVADTGPGIPADVRSRLFQPLVTTTDRHGVGLSVAFGSADRRPSRRGGTRSVVVTFDLDQCPLAKPMKGWRMMFGPVVWPRP